MKEIACLVFIILISFQSLADLGSLCINRPSKQDAIIYIDDIKQKNLVYKLVINANTSFLEDKEFEEFIKLVSPLIKKFICDPNINLEETKNYSTSAIQLTSKYSLITVIIELFAYNGHVFNWLWDGEKLSVAFFPEFDDGKVSSHGTPLTSIYRKWDLENKCLTTFHKAIGYDSIAGQYSSYYFKDGEFSLMKIIDIPIFKSEEDLDVDKRQKVIIYENADNKCNSF